MNDDLETQLEQLSKMPTRSAPTVADLHNRDRQRSLRRARIGSSVVAAAFVLVIGGAALGRRNAEPAGVASTGTPAVDETTTSPSTTLLPPDDASSLDPAYGYRISGPNGEIAGYIDQQTMDQAMNSGPPNLPIGTGAVAVHGFEVHSRQGELVGYFLESIGFLPLDQSADAHHVDQLVKSEPEMTQAEAKALLGSIKTEAEAQDD